MRFTTRLGGVLAASGLLWGIVSVVEPKATESIPTPAAEATPQPGSCEPRTAFARPSFPAATKVDNRWHPLKPGTQWVFEGQANRGGGLLPHRVTFTVTDLIKVVNGLPARVLWDVDENEGRLVEEELAFFAQDEVHNVWSLGEYPEEYLDGEFTGAPNTWISGEGEAQAGVLVPGAPQPDGPEFVQASVPEIEFLDCGRVISTSERTCVPAGCFGDVLEILERSPLDPAQGFQRKLYAPGVGNVEIGAVDDPEGETLVLTKVNHLDDRRLAEAREAVRRLEERAYEISEAYAQTAPAQRIAGDDDDEDDDRR